jgi:hypothetical protein
MRPKLKKRILSFVLLVLVAPAIYRSYRIFRADRLARTDKTIAGLSEAIAYDPSNATLWWHRGRLYHYAIVGAEIVKAARDYEQALSLNSRLGEAWADLADCYDQMGNYLQAESAFEKAFAVHRYSPLIRWQAGNFYLRRGNLSKMYECFKLASEYDPQKLAIATEVSWKSDSDHKRILQNLVPDALTANLSYLQFLVARDELDIAVPVWRRLIKNPIPDGTELKPSSSFSYIDHLIVRNRIPEAQNVWIDILRKTHTGVQESRLAHKPGQRATGDPEIPIWNASFENEIMNGGFDWRTPDRSAVKFSIDTSNRMHGLKSLQAKFQEENFSYDFLSQIVPVTESGSYQLDFYLRTDGLTTDQLPYLVIQGYPDAVGTYARSGFFPATAEWSKVSVPFTVKPGYKAIILRLQRDQSAKFDNAIRGRLWLDDFKLLKLRS